MIEPVLPLAVPLAPRMLQRPSVCIVSPVLGDDTVLPRFFDALVVTLDPLDIAWTAILVSDERREATARVLRARAIRDLRFGFVLLSGNSGRQASIFAGLDFANADIVITMDADLRHPPAVLPELIAAWRDGYDVVHARERLPRVPRVVADGDFRLIDRTAIGAARTLSKQRRLHQGLAGWAGLDQAVLTYAAPAREARPPQLPHRRLLSALGQVLFDFSKVPLRYELKRRPEYVVSAASVAKSPLTAPAAASRWTSSPRSA